MCEQRNYSSVQPDIAVIAARQTVRYNSGDGGECPSLSVNGQDNVHGGRNTWLQLPKSYLPCGVIVTSHRDQGVS